MDKWEDVPLSDYHDYSFEFGEKFDHVRRVRAVPSIFKNECMQMQGLARVSWFNPDDSGVDYEWLFIGFIGVI